MGYSFSTPCHSAKHAKVMAEFLGEHLRPFKEACEEHEALAKEAMDAVERLATRTHPLGWGYDISADAVCLGDEIAYGSAKSKVGFNSPVGEDTRYFMWSLLAWVAITMGRKRQCMDMTRLGIRQPSRYMTYDRTTKVVLLRSEVEGWSDSDIEEAGWRGWIRDSHGVLPARPAAMESLKKMTFAKFMLVRQLRTYALRAVTVAEMNRIAALWENR